jgi:hypothetical protein
MARERRKYFTLGGIRRKKGRRSPLARSGCAKSGRISRNGAGAMMLIRSRRRSDFLRGSRSASVSRQRRRESQTKGTPNASSLPQNSLSKSSPIPRQTARSASIPPNFRAISSLVFRISGSFMAVSYPPAKSAVRIVWSDGFSARRGPRSISQVRQRAASGGVASIWSIRQPSPRFTAAGTR